jgi:two-component system OmpR family sensor kinase
MLESLRARLLLWYTSILVLVILAFGGAVCYLFWRSLLTSLDEGLRQRARAIGASLQPLGGDTFELDPPEELMRYFQTHGGPRRYYVIWNDHGALVDRSDPDVYVPILEAAAARSRMGMREVAVSATSGATVLVAQETSDLRSEVWVLGWTVAGAAGVALGLSLLGGWFLVHGALAPIARISRTAKAMSEGDLSARIAIDRTETELGQVALTLNQAFDRLQDTLDRQRRFTADASHELRTPLSVLCLEVEWALARERGAAEYRETLDTCWRAAERMRAVIEGLLTLARADAGDLMLSRVPVALDEVAREVVAQLRPLATKRSVDVTVTGDAAEVSGDPNLLREVVINLVSNAIHYNRDKGRVELAVWKDEPSACLLVTDTGIGISSDDLPRVFERFFRADKARAREAGGAGLGLAVSRWIVESHGGEITCTSEVGRGTSFLVRLPLETAASPVQPEVKTDSSEVRT